MALDWLRASTTKLRACWVSGSDKPSWISNRQALATTSVSTLEPGPLTYIDALLIRGEPCAYSSLDGSPLPETYLTRGANRDTHRFPFQPRINPQTQADVILEEAYYISFYNAHFGHLLTESLAHAWHALKASQQNKPGSRSKRDKPLLIINNHIAPLDGPLYEQLCHSFNVRTNKSLPSTTLVRQLHAAVPTMVIRHSISSQHLERVQDYIGGQVGASELDRLGRINGTELVYISRERLPSGYRHLQDEADLTAIMRERGWSILHPQELSLHDQLYAYANARVIAGNLSSAFHLLMAFGQDSPTLRQKRVLPLTGASIPSTYLIQFALQGVEAHHLPCLTPIRHSREQAINPTLIDQHFDRPTNQLAKMLHTKAKHD